MNSRRSGIPKLCWDSLVDILQGVSKQQRDGHTFEQAPFSFKFSSSLADLFLFTRLQVDNTFPNISSKLFLGFFIITSGFIIITSGFLSTFWNNCLSLVSLFISGIDKFWSVRTWSKICSSLRLLLSSKALMTISKTKFLQNSLGEPSALFLKMMQSLKWI